MGSSPDLRVTRRSIAAVYGFAAFDAAFACLFAFFVEGLIGSPELEMPAWIGAAVVIPPMWVTAILVVPSDRWRRAALWVPPISLALLSLVPGDLAGAGKATVALLAALSLTVIARIMAAGQEHKIFGEAYALGLLALATPIVAYGLWHLLRSQFVATWSVAAATAISAALVVVTFLAVDTPRWRLRDGWSRAAMLALSGALVINGVLGFVLEL